MQDILDEIQELFFNSLNEKSGWGKNDIKSLYQACVLQVLKQRINQTITPQ